MTRALLLAFPALAGVAFADTAVAGHRGVVIHSVDPQTYVRGVGCYWEWGFERCARYCYIEVNGRQYCQEHRIFARPQGRAPVVEVHPGYRPLKD